MVQYTVQCTTLYNCTSAWSVLYNCTVVVVVVVVVVVLTMIKGEYTMADQDRFLEGSILSVPIN